MATEEKTILRVYGAFAATLIFMLVPHVGMCVIAILLMLGTTIAAYAVRRKAEAHSLAADHMTFIIRTIWIGSGLALITTALASGYMLATADMIPLQSCSDQVAQTIINTGTQDVAVLQAMMQPCINGFIAGNMGVLTNAVIMAAGAPMLYFAYRLAKGLSRARKGHRLGNVKSWL